MKFKILPVITAAALITGCSDKNDESENYIAVYEEFTSATSETTADTQTSETEPADSEITEHSGEFSYLDNVVFLGDESCRVFSEYGLMPQENVISVDSALPDEILSCEIDGKTIEEIIIEKNSPYIYLCFSANNAAGEYNAEKFGYKIVELAESIRTVSPESMVLAAGSTPLAADNSDMDEYNSVLHASVKSCPDEYIIYTEIHPAVSDYSGMLLPECDSGDGKNLSLEGAQNVLRYISANRFYNKMTENTDSEAVYADLKAEREAYSVTEGKVAYLTFDDGPSKYTTQILDILRENDIKATFFITGWCIEGKEMILKQTADEGHTIGIHSWSHDYEEVYSSKNAWLSDCLRVFRKVYAVTGEKPWAFRFPGGSYNNHNRDTADDIIEEMKSRGFAYYDWNGATADASSEATYESCMDYLRESINADHEVVLMHDSLEITPEYLQDVIDYLKGEGYTFETVDTADEVHF